jgi:hypothetical protein
VHRKHQTFLMVINNFHFVGMALGEAEAHAPRNIDRDRPLSSAAALQRMKADAPEDADLIKPAGGAEHCEPVERLLNVQP